MQTLEDILCDISHINEARLLPCARQAVVAPENGIHIINPVAKQVIKDCAYVTTLYLPFYVISKLGSPFSFYQKKVTLDQIKDFCLRSQSNSVTNQLLTLLVDKAKSQAHSSIDNFYDQSDPYNDFDEKNVELQKMHNYVYILSKAFGVI